MGDPVLLLCWYLCCSVYTVALTVNWTRKINHLRAAALWPVFWLVVAVNAKVTP